MLCGKLCVGVGSARSAHREPHSFGVSDELLLVVVRRRLLHGRVRLCRLVRPRALRRLVLGLEQRALLGLLGLLDPTCNMILLVAAAAAVPMTFRVATYNIDCRVCDLSHGHAPSWKVQAQRERDVLQEINADVVFLQEPVFPGDAAQILPTTRNWTILYDNGTAPIPLLPTFDPDATLAVDADRFAVDDWGYTWLGPRPSHPGSFDIFTLPRLAVWAHVHDRRTQGSMVLMSTHFDHGDGTGKSTGPSSTNCVQAAREIATLLRNDTRFADRPFIFGGDLNSKRASNAYQILLNTTLQETWDAAPAVNHTIFANSSSSAAAYDTTQAIDHILATPHFSVLAAGASVRVWEAKGKLVGPSDHWPVFADFQLA